MDRLRDLRLVAVTGPRHAEAAELAQAEEVGAHLADAGFALVTGGLDGVMEAASRGVKSRRGTTIGVLPGSDASAANGWVDLALPTGLGELRDVAVARMGLALIAIGRGHETLAEIGFALGSGRSVVALNGWDVHGVTQADSPSGAVERVARLLSQ